jgi:hypothetical protein
MLPRIQLIAPIGRPEPFDDPEWVFELKYDGFRGICYLEQGRCRMISRNGNLMSRFAGLGDQIAASLAHHSQTAPHPIGSETLGVRIAGSTEELQRRAVRLPRRPARSVRAP